MSEEPGTPPPEEPAPPRRPIARVRGAVNIILFISAGLFALGWLNLVFNVGHWEEARMARLATLMAYVGYVAILSFALSLILILVENRTAPGAKEDAP